MTIIYISHYMEEVQTLCRRIAIMDNGKLLACDTLPNLLKRLDTSIRAMVANTPPGFAEKLAAIPGVKRLRPTDGGFELVVDDIGPVLARVASECCSRAARNSPPSPRPNRRWSESSST